jgi:hypothetical protein
MSNGRTIGIAWFRREQWTRLRAVATDSHVLEESFERWAELAFKKCVELAAAGLEVERVDVDLGELIAWCRDERRPLDAAARAAFAALRLQQRYEAVH